MRYIEELREGDMVSEVYLCKNKISATAKNGKTYYSMQLQDKTGIIDAKIWDLNNGIGHFESMNYIHVDAQITSFNGSMQMNIKRVRIASEGEYLPNDYMPCSNKDIEEMFKDLLGLIHNISQPHLKKLLEHFFVEDKDFAKTFKNHSAAKTIHHGFVGGLLEHSLSVAKLCVYFAETYPSINKDLLVTAAICHDIGKIHELSPFPQNDYTDDGQLLGHIVMGTMMLDSVIKTIDGFPDKLATELKHCILSHHGELEYGSPKKPALLEALALAFADNTDAKLQSFVEAIENNDGNTGEWTKFQRIFDSPIRSTSN